jgi:hypothetical protein
MPTSASFGCLFFPTLKLREAETKAITYQIKHKVYVYHISQNS